MLFECCLYHRRVAGLGNRVSNLAKGVAVLAASILYSGNLHAQIDPSHRWLTLETQHFFVHFTAPTEGLARRIAADAERAYLQLSQEMHPPRGPIDIVISDDADISNGSATPFPTNRIVVYANPPVSESALRYTNDWGQLVITHELTHIFHLDRTRGIWALGQRVFGRAALSFPNFYSPSWLTEGLAVYEESKLTGAGRIQGSEHRMIARAAALDHDFPALGGLSLAQGRYPYGESVYSYGSLFVDYLARTEGASHVRDFVDKSAANLIPYLLNIPAKQAFGISFSHAWRDFSDSIARSVGVAPGAPVQGWQQLTRDGAFVFAPRWLSETSIIYSGAPARESFGAFRVDLTGRRTRVGRRNSRSPNVPLAGGALLYAQLDFTNPYQERSDLWIQRGRHEQQITFGQRLTTPDARADGAIVATQIIPGATRLVRVSPDGKRITPITTGSYDEQWTEPHWSNAGDRIAAVRWLRGNVSQIIILDSLGREQAVIASGNAIQATPSWAPGDSGVFFSSDWSGTAQLFYVPIRQGASAGDTRVFVVSNVATGLFEPQPSPAGNTLASVIVRSDGYHLGVSPCCDPVRDGWGRLNFNREGLRLTGPAQVAAPSVAPIVSDSGPITSYSPWRTFWPRYWLPTVDQGIDGGYRIGATTSGEDVIGRHSMNATIEFPTNKTGVVGNITYDYSGLGLPIIQLDGSQDWESLGGIFSRTGTFPLVGELFRRTLSGDALATWVRQRYRTSLAITGGVGIEHRTHVTTPNDSLLAAIDTTGAFGNPTFPSLIASASFANYQRPPLSISPEDGVQLGLTVRDRTRSGAAGTGGQSFSTVGTAALYKSLNLPGFAHHVLALRGSAGFADDQAAGYYSVGGINGSPFQVVPGYVIGEGRKTFPVRGFQPGTLIGLRAYTGSAEYRVPLFLIGDAPGALPFFLDRSSLTFFGDYGTAWCPDIRAGREVCNRASQSVRADIASIGSELNLNLGVLSWDSPYRFRLGVVRPTQNGHYFGRPSVQAYVVAGASF